MKHDNQYCTCLGILGCSEPSGNNPNLFHVTQGNHGKNSTYCGGFAVAGSFTKSSASVHKPNAYREKG